MVIVDVSQTNFTDTNLLHKVRLLTAAVKGEVEDVKCFQGRWKMLITRLQKLSSQFTQLESPKIFESAVCSELLDSVVASLEETRESAKECTELTFMGKLQTQSKLDALVTKFDLHIRDCQLVIKSGVLTDNSPSGLSFDSMKQAAKWTVTDLLARLQIGSTASKAKALTRLVNLMQEDDKNALLVANQGGISVIIQMLDASSVLIREKAAAAIRKLAAIDNTEIMVLMEGSICPLVKILETGSSVATENAVLALQCMTRSSGNACSVAANGGVQALLETCTSATPGAKTAAAGALCNLSSLPQLRRCMVNERTVIILLYLVHTGTIGAQEYAVGALQNLSQNDEIARDMIMKHDGLPPLLRFLDATESLTAKELIVGVLRNLSVSQANLSAFISLRILPRLACLMTVESSKVQQTAAAVLCHLATSTDAKKAIAEAGCIVPLVKMLDGKTRLTQEYAAQALSNLLTVESVRRMFSAEENAISGLVRLLESTDEIVTRQFVMSALFALSESGRCRKQMISAGACYIIERMADEEALGAKKLLERLQSGKLRNIFRKLEI